MSKEQNIHYVIKFIPNQEQYEECYWAGYKTVVDQIRKAQMYNKENQAHQAAKSALNYLNAQKSIYDYKLVVIEITIKDELESRI